MNNYLLPIITIVGAHVLVVVSPGPNFIISAKHGMSYPKQIFMYTTSGVATGTLIYLLMGFLGLSVVIAQSAVLYSMLRYFGAAYLIFIGINSLLQKNKADGTGTVSRESLLDIRQMQAYRIGLFTNLSNPKAALYFLALFTRVMTPNTPTEAKFVILVLLPIITWAWYSFVAVSFSIKRFQQLYAQFRGSVDILFGFLMIFLGLSLALSSK